MRGLRRFFVNWQNVLALAIVGFFVVVAAGAPLLAPPEDPHEPDGFKVVGRPYDRTPHPPSREALLGTMPRQLDVFFSLVWGTRHALRFGLVASLVTSCIGVVVGAVSGYAGGLVNRLTLRAADAFLALPVVAGVGVFGQLIMVAESAGVAPLAQAAIRLLGSDHVMLGLIFFSWMPYARIINVGVARLRHADYVTAAASLGASAPRIIFRHLMPNVIAPAVVMVARDIGAMVLVEAAFTFIGIGGGSPWGTMVALGRDYVIGAYGSPITCWWTYLPITLTLIVFGVGWNLLGDGLNSLLDPHATRKRARTRERVGP